MPVNTNTMRKQRRSNNPGRGTRGPARGNIHQNADNMKTPHLHGVYANPRFCDTIARLKGCQVVVQVKSGGVYDGILNTMSPKGEIVLNVSQRIDQSSAPGGVQINPLPPKTIMDKLVLKAASIVSISAKDVDMDFSTKSLESFATDSEIGGRVNGQMVDKKLEMWTGEGDDNEVPMMLDEDITFSSKGNGWTPEEMFETNKANFGYQSSYKENLEDYTTPLNEEDTPEFRERRKRAEKLAREIEQSPDHLSRETLENSEETTEEDKFSAVVRPGTIPNNRHSAPLNSSNTDRYVPPHQRPGGSTYHKIHQNRKNSPSGLAPSGPGRPSLQDRQMQPQPSRQVPQSHPSSQPHHASQTKPMASQLPHVPTAISQHRVPVQPPLHSGPQLHQQQHLGVQQHPASQPQSQAHQGSQPMQNPHVHHGTHGSQAQPIPQPHSGPVPQGHPGMPQQIPHSPTSPYGQPMHHHQAHHQQPMPQQSHVHLQKQAQPQSPPYQQAPSIQRHTSADIVAGVHNTTSHSPALAGRSHTPVEQLEARVSYSGDARQQDDHVDVSPQRKEAPHPSHRPDLGPRSPVATQPLSPTIEGSAPIERHVLMRAQNIQQTNVVENLKHFHQNFKLHEKKTETSVPPENKVPTPTSPAAVSIAEKPSPDVSAAGSATTEPETVAPPTGATSSVSAITEKNEIEEAEKVDRISEKAEKKMALNPDAPVFIPVQSRKYQVQKTPTPPPSRSPQQNVAVFNPQYQQQQQHYVMYQTNPYVVHPGSNMQQPQMVRAPRQKPTVSNIPRFSNEYQGQYPASMAGTPLITSLQPNQIIVTQQGAGQGPGIGGPFTHQVMPGQVIQQSIPYGHMYKQQGQMYRQVHPTGNHGTTAALQAQHQQLVQGQENSAMINQAMAYQQSMVQHQPAPAPQNPYSHPSAQPSPAQQMQHQPHPHAQQHTTPPLSQTQGHQPQAQQVMGPQGQFPQHGGRPSPGPVPQMAQQVHHVAQQQGLHQMMLYTQQVPQPPQPGQQPPHSGQQYIHPVSVSQHPHMSQNLTANQSVSHVPSNMTTNITNVTPVHTNPHPHPIASSVVYVSNHGQPQGTIPTQQIAHQVNSGQIVGPFIHNPQGHPPFQQGN